jgi:hypothetical protein
VRLEGLDNLKNFIYLIGSRTHNLPSCSIVPQPLLYRVGSRYKNGRCRRTCFDLFRDCQGNFERKMRAEMKEVNFGEVYCLTKPPKHLSHYRITRKPCYFDENSWKNLKSVRGNGRIRVTAALLSTYLIYVTCRQPDAPDPVISTLACPETDRERHCFKVSGTEPSRNDAGFFGPASLTLNVCVSAYVTIYVPSYVQITASVKRSPRS